MEDYKPDYIQLLEMVNNCDSLKHLDILWTFAHTFDHETFNLAKLLARIIPNLERFSYRYVNIPQKYFNQPSFVPLLIKLCPTKCTHLSINRAQLEFDRFPQMRQKFNQARPNNLAQSLTHLQLNNSTFRGIELIYADCLKLEFLEVNIQDQVDVSLFIVIVFFGLTN